jgi:hypothetical protein
MKSRFLLPLCLVVWLLASGCAPAPQLLNDAYLNDSSFVSGDPCEAPCWQNLIAGESAWGLAQDFITNNADYSSVISNRDRDTGEAWIEFAYQNGPVCCRIYSTSQETLSSVYLLLRPQNTVREIVERYGEPQFITAQAKTPEQSIIALVYSDLSFVVYVFAENLSESQVNEDSQVIGMAFHAPSVMGTVLQTETLFAWNGFGTLGEILAQPEVTLAPATE